MADIEIIVNELAKRFSSIKQVSKEIEKENSKYPSKYRIDLSHASSGFPSLCMLFSELNNRYPDSGYDVIAHNYLVECTKNLNMYSTSLLQGLTGIGMTVYCMSNNGKRYKVFLNNLNETIKERTQSYIEFTAKSHELKEEFYDVITGLSGVASYYLHFLDDKEMVNQLKEILKYLTSISLSKDTLEIEIKKSFYMNFKENNHDKYINLGFAHGIAGILTILVQTYKQGVYVKDQINAIKYISNYLLNICIKDENGISWAYNNLDKNSVSTRDAWCYGTPGVAYSLLQAASLLKDKNMHDIACTGMKTALKLKRGLNSSTFCHGYCGIMYITKCFYDYTKNEFFKDEYYNLRNEIIKQYNPNYPFGYVSKELVENELVPKNEIGILTGVSGILLVLLDSLKESSTPWNHLFLLRKIKEN